MADAAKPRTRRQAKDDDLVILVATAYPFGSVEPSGPIRIGKRTVAGPREVGGVRMGLDVALRSGSASVITREVRRGKSVRGTELSGNAIVEVVLPRAEALREQTIILDRKSPYFVDAAIEDLHGRPLAELVAERRLLEVRLAAVKDAVRTS